MNYPNLMYSSSYRAAFLGIALTALSVSTASALDFSTNFSTGEGYSSGQLNASSDWSGAADFSVTPSASSGVVSTPTTLTRRVYHTTAFDSGINVYQLSTDFSFTASAIPNKNSAFFGVSLIGDPTASANSSNMAMEAGIYQTTAGTYKVEFITIGFGGQFSLSSGAFAAAQIGIDGISDFNSDNLRLVLSVTKGANASDWSYLVTLENLDNSSLSSISVTASSISSTADFYSDASLFGGLNTQDSANAQISAVAVSGVALSQQQIPEGANVAQLAAAGVFVLVLSRRRRTVDSRNAA